MICIFKYQQNIFLLLFNYCVCSKTTSSVSMLTTYTLYLKVLARVVSLLSIIISDCFNINSPKSLLSEDCRYKLLLTLRFVPKSGALDLSCYDLDLWPYAVCIFSPGLAKNLLVLTISVSFLLLLWKNALLFILVKSSPSSFLKRSSINYVLFLTGEVTYPLHLTFIVFKPSFW